MGALIRAARRNRSDHPELNFIALALQGKKVNFAKVLKMIDDMVAVLKTEQLDDDDKKKGLERSVSNLEKAIAKGKETIAALAAEIKSLSESIVALDKSVAEATEQK